MARNFILFSGGGGSGDGSDTMTAIIGDGVLREYPIPHGWNGAVVQAFNSAGEEMHVYVKDADGVVTVGFTSPPDINSVTVRLSEVKL